jgi:hypothetical protein
MNVHLTLKSANAKTGPIPVSTTEESSCAPSCPFDRSGCYAQTGPLALHWRKVSAGERGMGWKTFCNAVHNLPDGQLWRHNQAGDLPHTKGEINRPEAFALAAANVGKRGFTYTHHDIDIGKNWRTLWAMNEMGLTVSLSGNSVAHADELAVTKLPVVAVIPHDVKENFKSPGGRQVVVCPATIKEGVNCANCQLCFQRERNTIVGFPAHGTGWKKVEVFAKLPEEIEA